MPLHQETDTHLWGAPGCAEKLWNCLLFLCHVPGWDGAKHILSGFQACAILISQRRFFFYLPQREKKMNGNYFTLLLTNDGKGHRPSHPCLRRSLNPFGPDERYEWNVLDSSARLMRSGCDSLCLSACFSAPVPSHTHTCTQWHTHPHT